MVTVQGHSDIMQIFLHFFKANLTFVFEKGHLLCRLLMSLNEWSLYAISLIIICLMIQKQEQFRFGNYWIKLSKYALLAGEI